MIRRSFVFTCILMLCGRLAYSQQVKATTLYATVADARTGLALESAEILLMDIMRFEKSDAFGHARLAEIPVGLRRVRVRHLGYRPLDVEVRFEGDSTERLFKLEPTPHVLDTVDVSTRAVAYYLTDFEVRRKMGVGRFLTEADLDREGNRDFLLVALSKFSGVRQVVDDDGKTRLASTRSNCGADRPLPSLHPKRFVQSRMGGATGSDDAGGSCFGGRPCLLQVFVDDLNPGEQDFDLVRTWDLAGVEFYSGASMPVRYRVNGSACGVLLLWSKR